MTGAEAHELENTNTSSDGDDEFDHGAMGADDDDDDDSDGMEENDWTAEEIAEYKFWPKIPWLQSRSSAWNKALNLPL
jgi:hypothetical protein